MNLNFFENNIFSQNFNKNLNKIVWRIFFNFKEFFEELFKDIPRIFLEYFPKSITKLVKKQASVACVILFTLSLKKKLEKFEFLEWKLHGQFKPIWNTLEMNFEKGLWFVSFGPL